MPVRYESAAPVGAFLRRGYGGGGGGGGGGGYAGGGGGVDPRLYAAQQASETDYMRMLQGTGTGITGEHIAAGALQRQKYELTAWLQEQEMTQAEQMRLKQEKNAVALINQQRGKNLTDQQADDAIVQLVGKINVGDMRIKKQVADANEMQKKAMADAAEHLAKVRERELAISGMGLKERTLVKVPTQVMRRINQELDEIEGPVDQNDPQAVAARMKKAELQAIDNGEHFEYILGTDGNYQPLGNAPAIGDKGNERGQGAGGGGAGSRTQQDKPFSYSTALTESKAELTGKVTEDDPEYEKKVGEAIERRKTEYDAASKAKAGQDPENQRKAAAQLVKVETDRNQAYASVIQGSNLDPNLKQTALMYLGIRDRIIKKFGPPDQIRNPEIKAKLDRVADGFMAIYKRVQDQAPREGQAGQTPPGERTMWGVEPGIGNHLKAIGGSIREGLVGNGDPSTMGRRRPGEY